MSMLVWLYIVSLLASPPHKGPIDELDAPLAQFDGSEASLTELEQAIARVEQHGPEIAANAEALKTLSHARLLLARALLAHGAVERAELAMDEAIRSSLGDTLPTDRFSPELMQLHDRRVRELSARGHGVIEVSCAQPCALIIDEHRSPNPSEPLLLGRYRVWTVRDDGQTEQHMVDIARDGQVETLSPSWSPVGDLAATEQIPQDVRVEPLPTRTTEAPRPRKSRLLPRWPSALGITTGVGLLVAGATLSALHGRCVGGDQPSTCPNLYDNTPQSQVLLGIGGGLLAAWSTVLIYDEIRIGRTRGHQTTLVWTFSF